MSYSNIFHTFLVGPKILYCIPPFEQFTTFFSENQQDFSLMLTLYGINVCYYFYILWGHFSKMIMTTEELITAH